ncbi:peptidoglycan-binding domain-containing protein, partial [Verminephrobacter aporrectodeae]|uniref:peptidoglycan-binding domain-containing protein n=1 Tax=Verminephrobacter aporrectodeae TaxID=1110389 RepID=UPI002243F7CD
MPPVGTNNVLTSEQLRYCVAEEIRLNAAKEVTNNYNDSDVDRFNGIVADYNSRCGQSRYRSGSLEGARAEVERYRAVLEADGRARFVQSKSASSQDWAVVSEAPTPDPMVKAIQERLNELGYDAGAADGLFGGKTRAAILAFQRGNGFKEDETTGTALLNQLWQATSQVSSESVTRSGSNFSSRSAPAEATGSVRPNVEPQPSNAHIVPPSEPSSLAAPGMPDLSRTSTSEQAAIENACSYHKRNSGPGDYYSCLRRELAALGSFQGKPDMSRTSASEQATIENACSYHKRNSGPGEYYSCLRRELAALGSFQGKPDMSRTNTSEQAAIENACSYHKRNSGPGEYYSCLRRELAALGSFQGKPDMSRTSTSEQA